MLSKINNPQSICILRLSAIGDVCHAVAAVQAIQKRWPQAQITWVIGQVEYMLLEGLTGVEFVIFDKKAGLRGYWDLKKRLENRSFDILLHMQVALRASLATLCIRAKEKWGFDKNRLKEGQQLFTNRRIAAQEHPHVAEGFMAFARAIGVAESAPFVWRMPISQQAVEWHEKHFAKNPSYLVIAPAASKAERNWLPERYAAVAEYAHKKGMQIVLCGGPSVMEKSLAESIQSQCSIECRNFVGKTSLKQLLVLLQSARLVVAPDTGPAHIAVTVGTPVVGLYAHSNPRRTGPYLYQEDVASVYDEVIEEETGKSWQLNSWGKRAKGQALMARISVELVIEKVEQLLKKQ